MSPAWSRRSELINDDFSYVSVNLGNLVKVYLCISDWFGYICVYRIGEGKLVCIGLSDCG